MSDNNKLDSFFNQTANIKRNKKSVSEKLRLILPLIAVLLIGMLVLFPSIEEEVNTFAFEITKPQKGELEKLMVENLNFYVSDNQDLIHNFKAMHIEEVDVKNKITKLEKLGGIYNQDSNNWFNVETNEGYFYQNENLLKMPNVVKVFYSDGMEFEAVDVISDFKKNVVSSKKPIEGDGFFGKINADGFEHNLKTDVLSFVGNVKIIKSEEK